MKVFQKGLADFIARSFLSAAGFFAAGYVIPSKNRRWLSRPICAFRGTELGVVADPPAVAPSRNRTTALSTAAFLFRGVANLGHDGEVVLALTIGPLAVERTTAQALAFKFLATETAWSTKSGRAELHFVARPVAVDNARRSMGRIAVIKPIPATLRTETVAPIDHAVAA